MPPQTSFFQAEDGIRDCLLSRGLGDVYKRQIEHQNVHRRRRSSSSASLCIRVYTSEDDFHKPEIYGGRVRVWATEWDVFYRAPSRGGRGRRAAVDIFRGVFFQCLVGFRSFFFRFLYFERTRPTASTRQPCLMHLSTSIVIYKTGLHLCTQRPRCLWTQG